MQNILLWLYLANATLLIVHEIDSAYYREWELFGLPGGSGGFVALHIPMVAVMLYGLTAVYERAMLGMVLSLVLAAGGVFAFGIHTYFIRKGRPEFTAIISRAVLWATLLVSLIQLGFVLRALLAS